MKTNPLTALICIALLQTACIQGDKMRMGPNSYAPTNPESVAVLWEAPNRSYEEIGIVSAQGGMGASDTGMIRKLRQAAADLGADAVIVMREGSTPIGSAAGLGEGGTWGAGAFAYQSPKNMGRAIKYRQ
jgi:hypothetical protein